MDQGLFSKYLVLIKALRLFGLQVTKDEEKQKFFSEQILDLFYLDFVDVGFWINRLLANYSESPDIVSRLRKVILTGLENNSQRIGKDNLVIAGSGQSQTPSVKNWLKDYIIFTRSAKNINTGGGALDQVSYLNLSSNAKHLDQKNRNALFKLIKFYDWIRFGKLNFDFSLAGQIKQADIELEGNKHELIPKDLADLVNQAHNMRLNVRVKA